MSDPKAEPSAIQASTAERTPLTLLRDTEQTLRLKTLSGVSALVPPALSPYLRRASAQADTSLAELAQVDLSQIDAQVLQPARLRVGLGFVGLGAMLLAMLLVYTTLFHPELDASERLHAYWHLYIAFVSLGIAGLLLWFRESAR